MIILADTSLPTLCWTALFNNSLVLIGVFDRVASMAGPKAFWGVSRTLRMAWASHQGNLVGWPSGWSPAHHGGQRPPRCYGCQARPLELYAQTIKHVSRERRGRAERADGPWLLYVARKSFLAAHRMGLRKTNSLCVCTYITILLAGYHWIFQSKHQLMEIFLERRLCLGRVIHLEKYSATMIWGPVFSPNIQCLCKPGRSQCFGLSGSQNCKKREQKKQYFERTGGVWEVYARRMGNPNLVRKTKIWQHWIQ